MRTVREFEVECPREVAAEIAGRDETLVDLFPDAETEIVAVTETRKTVVSRYTVLGREGEATFHFDYMPDGNVAFGKVCDGRVWERLEGTLDLESCPAGTRVRLQLEGATKSFVPEFTIKGPLEEQIDEMAAALRARMGRS
jgi:hypothetical protein